ncbi:PepSY-associated TM helix domain-containing protein [Pedobacter yulinensis]|uniref:PepSY-associated TM helix domain-containing protein n=1 Tax=Pedobacter yulinensis TaxID=2126353 RepID=UPI001EF9920C|nr:PepSY-associated TM helix domain-containing protein [Pedobacter yulinensis]
MKKLAGKLHLWLGLATGLIVIIIGLTGCLYVFEAELRQWSQADYLSVPARAQPRLTLDRLLDSARLAAQGSKIMQVRVTEQQPGATVAMVTKDQRVLFLDPYTGLVVHRGGQDWLAVVQSIHISLLLGETGKAIIKWSVVIFVLMLATGLILWFPGQLRLLRQSLTIKRKASFKRLNYDLHNVLGFYASFVLLITACSGLFFAFKEVKSAVAFFTGSRISEGIVPATPVRFSGNEPAMYRQMYEWASLRYPGAGQASFSVRKNGELRLRLLFPYKWYRKQHTFFFNAENGTLKRYKLYPSFSRADKAEALNYDLHTGQLFGLPGKILACLASLTAASLPVTGFIIWWKKGRKRKPRTRRHRKLRLSLGKSAALPAELS